jgi:L-ascorbate metabolism protein UlaG (beta-lactamase superfamily)
MDEPAGRRWPDSFADRLTSSLPGVRDVIRMMRERGPARNLAAGAAAVPLAPGRGVLPGRAAGEVSVTWVGHATFLLRFDAARGGPARDFTVLTDPVWSSKIPGVAPRITPVGVDWRSLPPVDAVVISHNHYDHLDAGTVSRLPRHTPVLVPARLGRWFRRRGFTDVTELDWWESHRIGPVAFDFVPAHHWSRRTLTDTCRTLWGGWVMTSGTSRRIYFAGDTGYGHWFTEIGARYPVVDLALMPVGAYDPQWFMQPVHLNPEEAVRACDDLGAARMATMHWGTFILSAEPVAEPAERAAKAWAAAGRARDDLWDLAIGETRML